MQVLLLCRTYSFLALVVLLRCPPEQLQQQGHDASVKFGDLAVKCLIKLTKALQSTLEVLFAMASACMLWYYFALVCVTSLPLHEVPNAQQWQYAGVGLGHATNEHT